MQTVKGLDGRIEPSELPPGDEGKRGLDDQALVTNRHKVEAFEPVQRAVER
jgi:hypothetical protein